MPHKKNPIHCERICGLARVLRGYVQTALENVALWHERDITHSSAERIIIADAATVMDYMLGLLDQVLAGLGVHPQRMKENLTRLGGAMFSQRLLLVLAEKMGSRDRAYAVVQRLAQAGTAERPFEVIVRADRLIGRHLTPADLDDAFDWRPYLRRARMVLKRALADRGA